MKKEIESYILIADDKNNIVGIIKDGVRIIFKEESENKKNQSN